MSIVGCIWWGVVIMAIKNEKYFVSNELIYFESSRGILAFSPVIPAWVRVSDDSKELLEAIKHGQSINDFAEVYAIKNGLEFNDCRQEAINFLETSPVVTKHPINEVKEKNGDFDELDQVWLCPSGWCNLSCCYCAINPSKIQQEQKPLNFWIDVVRQCIKLGAKEFVISGSEPTLYPNCIDLLVWINNNTSSSIQLLTNGTLLKGEDINRLLETRAAVQVSLDGISQETNDSIRGKDSFNKIVNVVEELVKAGLKPDISMTVCKTNIGDVELMPDFAANLGCHGLRISPYFDTGRAAVLNSNSLSDEERVDVTLKILRMKKRSKIPISCGIGNLEMPKIGDKSNLCGCAHGMIAVNYDGGIYACPDAFQIDNSCAGYINNEPLSQILESTLFKKIRSASMFDIDECRVCVFRNLCGAGCPMERSFLKQLGFPYTKDCLLTKTVLEKVLKEEV